MNAYQQQRFPLQHNGAGSSAQHLHPHPYQQAMTNNIPFMMSQTMSNVYPYARMSSGPIVMMSSGAGAVAAVNLNTQIPMTSFVRNVTPEYHLPLMSAAVPAPSPLVGVNLGYQHPHSHQHDAINMTNMTTMNSAWMKINSMNATYPQMPFYSRTAAPPSQTQIQTAINAAQNRLNLCTDSLIGGDGDDDDSSGDESDDSEITHDTSLVPSLSIQSMCPPTLSTSISLPAATVPTVPRIIPMRTKLTSATSRKRNFDSIVHEKKVHRSTAPSSGVKYKRNNGAGAGAASWNAAVRNDINKIHVTSPMKNTKTNGPNYDASAAYKTRTPSAALKCPKRSNDDSPSSSSSLSLDDIESLDGSQASTTTTNTTDFLCEICEEAVFSTYDEALSHEAICLASRKNKNKNTSTPPLQSSPVKHTSTDTSLTSLVRAITDENNHDSNNRNVTTNLTTFKRTISNDIHDINPHQIQHRFQNNAKSALTLTSLKRTVTDEHEHEMDTPSFDQSDQVQLCQPVTQTRTKLVLATKEDKHWLSDLVCLIRENIEVFPATPDDVAARSRRGGIKKPIAQGRVGIRCIHCVDVPHEQKAKGAVSYPNSIRIVHQAVRNWQRYHFDACDKIPESVKNAYAALKSTRSHSGNASLKYWIDSTIKLGLVDTTADDGIRFGEGKNPTFQRNHTNGTTHNLIQEQDADIFSKALTELRSFPSSTVMEIDRPKDDLTYDQPSLVVPSDRAEITDFLYELLDQQQACQYKTVDRNGKRKYRDLGFPGVECKHCARNAGAGRYFPLMVTTLANNNNPFNCTHSHMMKCRRCPQEVKNKLAQLQLMHAEQGTELTNGWKKMFFDKLWIRLHGSNSTPIPEDDNNHTNPVSDMDSAAQALSSFSAQAFSDAARANEEKISVW